jgi:predicted MPP superfamily phosphohydrolase
MSFLTHNQWLVTRKTLRFDQLPLALRGLRLVQLSDLHFYEHTDLIFWRAIIDTIHALEPDILVCTGDIIHHGSRFLGVAGKIMSQLQGRLGQWGILGNHDYHDGARGQAVTDMMQDSGWLMLRNRYQVVDVEGVRLCVSGVDDMLAGQPDFVSAIPVLRPPETFPSVVIPPDFTVMLAHNPMLFDVITTRFASHVNLVLSGHTHAGHVYVPTLRWAYDELFKIPYRYGHYQRDHCQLFVSSGVESTAFYLFKQSLQIALPRYRVNCYPEIVCLELQSTEAM